MQDLNSFTVSGHLGRDAESRTYGDNGFVASFSLAQTIRTSKGEEETLWWNCSIFGKFAQAIINRLKKGTKVFGIAEIVPNNYTDKNGVERNDRNLIFKNIIIKDKDGGSDSSHKNEASADEGGWPEGDNSTW